MLATYVVPTYQLAKWSIYNTKTWNYLSGTLNIMKNMTIIHLSVHVTVCL